ncbi:hypothetical protein BKP45_03550 [Anaerobacillus alkalidiazotrophicus]|uniref:NERD domain-containing protein n=1 Tax=Anaerobacillus alkalidiazotrophicus TaxID=472963 RepID=A0A1S2MB35_9BACI|nr:nuclease-related domain-containing protein [Anaerobacillus alkalidiazotrophicus]OIJ21784.1 hypothetical protein BKP45_03550 [Anaerobacillus alkalidiazotrophicus]
MIEKHQSKSPKIYGLEALNRRVPPTHFNKTKIENDLSLALSGYRGEKSISYYLSFLNPDKYSILHGLRLRDALNRYFQIDFLLLSNFFHMIVEVKNLSGNLYLMQDPNQLVRTSNDNSKEYFQDPILQVRRQIVQLQSWMKKYNYPPRPIIYLIVFANSNAVIEIASDYVEAKETVIRAEALPFKIEEIEATYTIQNVQQIDIKKLIHLLIKKNEPLYANLLQTYEVRADEVIKGVSCPNCSQIPMKRLNGTWYCPRCTTKSKEAYVASLRDFQLLFGPTINNSQFRSFLKIDSRSVATRLLKSLNLNHSGQQKNRKYMLPPII